MALIPTPEPIGQPLTPDEYDALPENSLRELVDGVVHVMATPTPWHQDVKIALVNALRRLAPEAYRVTNEVEIRLGDLLRRNPDVVVVQAQGYNRRVPRLLPEQVVLAVEVVSPGSESMDREIKPREYGCAGIEHYWRIETDPQIVVHTFRLGDGRRYLPTGIFGRGDLVMAAGLGWAKVPVAALDQD